LLDTCPTFASISILLLIRNASRVFSQCHQSHVLLEKTLDDPPNIFRIHNNFGTVF
jgi:hypothetical protein